MCVQISSGCKACGGYCEVVVAVNADTVTYRIIQYGRTCRIVDYECQGYNAVAPFRCMEFVGVGVRACN